jgi:hypothetical protein
LTDVVLEADIVKQSMFEETSLQLITYNWVILGAQLEGLVTKG